MATITVLTLEDSGLTPAFGNIRSIEIEPTPLGSGGFGAVHACMHLDGNIPQPPLVIKVLHDDGTGSAVQNFTTVQTLQDRVRSANAGRRMRGEPTLEDIPALKGLPLFRFTGTLAGQAVCGYAAYRLDTEGYVPFDSITDGDASVRLDYMAMLPDARYQLASDLAEAFAILRDELGFVHADLNAPNLWVNLTTGHLVVIDFDSGMDPSRPGAQASTLGKLGEFLAPEAAAQLAQGSGSSLVPVNFETDAWAVMVGIAYLLFLCHPLVFLERLSMTALQEYFTTYAWPDIQRSDPNFNNDNGLLYDWFCGQVGGLPPAVREAFAETLQKGFADPSLRTKPGQWRAALLGQASQPVIHLFETDITSVASGSAVELRWWVEGALEISIEPGIGSVAATQSRLVFPRSDTTYTLTARGLFGSATSTCGVQVTPRPPLPTITLPVPTPQTPLQGTRANLHFPPLRLHGSSMKTGLRTNHLTPGAHSVRGSRQPVLKTRHLTLTLPVFPWQALLRRLNAMSLQVR